MPKKYNTLPVDHTGKTIKENRVENTFWKYNKVKDMMTLSPEDLDKAIDKFLAEYEARQIKLDKQWWYPTVTIFTLNDIRNKRTGIDKRPKIH